MAWMGAAGMLAAATIAGCGPAESSKESSKEGSQPSRVEAIAGGKTARVILTAHAATLIGLRTDLVRKSTTVTTQTTVPVAALVYESDGTVWVYTAQVNVPANAPGGAVTFIREAVTILRIDGDVAVLQSGPPVGTSVVTVGTAELLGTERGVEGG
jgi:ABC-type oligopeptide transport system substrate-binding subunit